MVTVIGSACADADTPFLCQRINADGIFAEVSAIIEVFKVSCFGYGEQVGGFLR